MQPFSEKELEAVVAVIDDGELGSEDARISFASSAAGKGIPVIPLRPNSKKAFKGWSEASTDLCQIKRWAVEHPDCNFGLVMGNGWVCLDLDSHRPEQDGARLFHDLYPAGVETFSVRTPNSGLHLYFSTGSESYRTRTSSDGIDIIGERQYVVAPHSALEAGVYEPIGGIESIAALPDDLHRVFVDRFIGGADDLQPVAPEANLRSVAREAPPSAHPLSENERQSLKRMLAPIDPDLPYDYWYRVIFAVFNIWGYKRETADALRQWSNTSEKWDGGVFEEKLRSYRDNHKDRLGLSSLSRAASRYPKRKAAPAISVSGTTEEYLMRLVGAHSKATEALLVKFGCIPTNEHSAALAVISDAMIRGLFCPDDFRIAFPLETGMGKTTSVIGICQVIVREGLQKSLLIAAERVEQLADLRSALLEAGIPPDEIGLIHNTKQYQATVPAISPYDSHRYRFLLVCHERIKSLSKRGASPEQLMKFGDGRRDLVVWDESLISSRGFHASKRNLIDSIQLWLGRHEALLAEGRKAVNDRWAGVYKSIDQFLRSAKSKLLPATDEIIELDLPVETTDEAQQAIRNVLGHETGQADHIANLERLLEFAERGVIRVKAIPGDHCLLQYEQTIDAAFNKVIVLDASCHIRQIAQYDPKLVVHSLPIAKRYEDVTIRWTDARASKTSFAHPISGEGHFRDFAQHLDESLPDYLRAEGMIVCHQDHKAKVSKSVDALIAKHGWGIQPVHTLHWGQHRATNKYRNCRWTFFWGLHYLPRGAVAAMAIGQIGRYDYEFLEREIDDLLESELAESIYQAISRGNSRNTIEGRAGTQVIDLVIPEIAARNVLELLRQVMPGVAITKRESPHLGGNVRLNAIDYIAMAEDKAKYVSNVPSNRLKVSKREINNRLAIDSNSSTSRKADEHLLKLLVGWREEGRSFVRS